MKISKKSWHYKLNNTIKSNFTYMPNDICSYIIMTIKSIGFVLFMVLVSTIVFTYAGMAWTDKISMYFQIEQESWLCIFYTFLAGIPTTIILIFVTFYIIVAISWLHGIIKAFIKNHIVKDKRCKEIDYED